MPESFHAVFHDLKAADSITELADKEQWADMICRIKQAGAIHRITEETYWYFLEVLPPKWQGRNGFAFAEGMEPLQIFWQQAQDDYRTRSLSWDETTRFCEACGIPKHYWG